MKKMIFLIATVVVFSLTVSAQDSSSFNEYYGKYKFAEGSPVTEVEIVWQDNTISVTSDMGTSAMKNTGIDTFDMDYMGGSIIFSRDSATQQVKGLTIVVSGMELVATREIETTPATGTSRIKIVMKKEDLFSLN